MGAIRSGGEAAKKRAMEEFARRYHQPVFRFLRALTRDDEEARELAQGFFLTVILERNLIARADRAKGRFRSYLMQSLRNYAVECFRRRGEKTPFVRPDAEPDGWERVIPPSSASLDQQFHAGWIEALLTTAQEKLREVCAAKGQLLHFEIFKAYYLEEPEAPPAWRDLGARFGIDEKTARNRAETARFAYGKMVLDLLVEETGSEAAAREELKFLRSATRPQRPAVAAEAERKAADATRIISLLDLAAAVSEQTRALRRDEMEPGLLCIAECFGTEHGSSILSMLCNPATPLAKLREIKDLSKRRYAETASEAERVAAALVYDAAIAVAYGVNGLNISSLPIEQRLPVFERLAAQFAGERLGGIFRRALDRAPRR